MATDLRIPEHPHFKINRGKKVTFQYNGKAVVGYTGETIAAALYADGQRIFSRSFKYHRPRGLFCLAGHCSQCLMRVDGIPNTRICTVGVQPGMQVESQNAWPSLNFDVAAVSGYLDFLIRPGFQYQRFVRPRWLYHIWERFLARMAGIGYLSDIENPKPPRRLKASPEVAVIGGGIAGLSAALHAGRAGADVWLIEKEDQPGGRIQYDTTAYDLPGLPARQPGFAITRQFSEAAGQLENCRVMTGATALAWYDEGLLAVVSDGELWQLTPQRLVVATGSYENPMVFENNDLPGIFLAGGLLRLMHRDFVRPGNTAAVVTNNNRGYELACQLMDGGVKVAAVIDQRPAGQVETSAAARQVKDAAVPAYPHHDVARALGRRRLKGVRINSLNTSSENKSAHEINIACDVLAIAASRVPTNELIFQRTSQGHYILESPHQFTRRPLTKAHMRVEADLFVAGEASGSQSVSQSWLEGKVAGLSAAFDLGYGGKELAGDRDQSELKLDPIP